MKGPNLVGLGLRTEHFNYLLDRPQTEIGWFEAITENFIDTEGAPLHVLTEIRKDYPVALHGVALSIGSVDGVSLDHLKKIKALAERIEPFQISDHFCFSRFQSEEYHELLPLPLTFNMAERVVQNIDKVQNYLGCALSLENISAYLEYPENEMGEAEFLNSIAKKSGCRILLDVNNIFVNATNFRFNARRFLRQIDPTHVSSYHIAGFTDMGTHLFDTHGAKIAPEVLTLYREARALIGDRPVSLERDTAIPKFRVCEKEIVRAQNLSPQDMPSRFSTTRPLYPSAVGTKTGSLKQHKSSRGVRGAKKNLTKETRWQKNIYSIKLSGAQRAAGTLTFAAAQKVYRTAHAIRHTQALEEKFYLLKTLVGERAFTRITKSFREKYKSTTPDLGRYGDKMPLFLAREIAKKKYLADLARLELARYQLFCQGLGGAIENPLEKKIKLSAACYLWKSSFALFDATHKTKLQLKRSPAKAAQYLLLYRHGFAVESLLLSSDEYLFLTYLTKPCALRPLLESVEATGALSPASTQRIFQILGLPGLLE